MTVPDQAAGLDHDSERHVRRYSLRMHRDTRVDPELQTPINAPQAGQLKLFG